MVLQNIKIYFLIFLKQKNNNNIWTKKRLNRTITESGSSEEQDFHSCYICLQII